MPGRGQTKYKPEYVIRIYEFAKNGMTDGQIADALGVKKLCMVKWKKDRPEVAEALRKGRETKDSITATQSFLDHVYGRLPDDLKALWDEIHDCDNDQIGDVARLEKLLKGKPERTKQHLFLYALVACNFNATEACRKLYMPAKIVENWCYNDSGFAKIIEGVHKCKEDFFESALIQLVKNGDSAATIFAAKTLLRGRGYADKTTVDVNVSGQVNHAHGFVDIESLNLSTEAKLEILRAHRAQRQLTEGPKEVIDVGDKK